jgi:hypothetical protein
VPVPPNAVWEAFRGASGDALTLIQISPLLYNNLVQKPHQPKKLREARPYWNVIKAPCDISGCSYKVFISHMDHGSLNQVYSQKEISKLKIT